MPEFEPGEYVYEFTMETALPSLLKIGIHPDITDISLLMPIGKPESQLMAQTSITFEAGHADSPWMLDIVLTEPSTRPGHNNKITISVYTVISDRQQPSDVEVDRVVVIDQKLQFIADKLAATLSRFPRKKSVATWLRSALKKEEELLRAHLVITTICMLRDEGFPLPNNALHMSSRELAAQLIELSGHETMLPASSLNNAIIESFVRPESRGKILSVYPDYTSGVEQTIHHYLRHMIH
jgi:hypothetical protein